MVLQSRSQEGKAAVAGDALQTAFRAEAGDRRPAEGLVPVGEAVDPMDDGAHL